MIGVFGFWLAAIIIAAFAYTADKAYVAVPPRRRQLWTTAFGLLSAAMLTWGLAVAASNAEAVAKLVLASDVLLFLGTACMLQSLMERHQLWLSVAMGLAISLCIGLRAYEYLPTAYVRDGLLYFDLSSGVRSFVIGGFLLGWLPAVMLVARNLGRDRDLVGFGNIFTASFMSLVVVTALFLSARRAAVIITLFSAIIVLFLVMTIANILILKLHHRTNQKHGGVHAAKPTR